MDKTNWKDAQDICTKEGADLVTIWNGQTQNVVNEFDAPFWIGASDQGTEGEWQTPEKKALPYSNWRGDEPNGGNVENCAVNIENGKWEDWPCTMTHAFICQWKSGMIAF